MNKLEISFSSRVPYNNDDEHLNRSTSMDFDLDLSNPEEVVRQFNKFLSLNDINLTVVEDDS
jgi:hypothetical protein